MDKEVSVFETLNAINVNDKIEKKNGLSYLSWAYAWGEVKKIYPDANYIIYERETVNGPINYFTDGRTCWVKTGVIISSIEHIEQLPVMDYKNKSIPLNNITSFDVNKAIQRSLTKALARHGLGLYIYAGEDLPEESTQTENRGSAPKQSKNDKSRNDQTSILEEKQNKIWSFYGEHKKTFGPVLKGMLQGRNLRELPEQELDGLLEIIETSQNTFGGN